ncbi:MULTISPECIES: TcdA/TcdB pore-forming domain-containing protein [unclassified Pseudomonas]|uniref:TcdA/TcdB pore-forming domain-containing protein n=1 Tax=unclassified Pseudomonas TaxID=196821 RepID=UPI001587981F|nr:MULTISPECIES: TcdA/TcdB pore-forming domain-containing protein [unclassified Pseudomonas]
MNFVWVGGSEVGQIQRDYMNIWREVLAPHGYTFNLWYDSDAVLAFEMNRVILDSARAHAMESGGDQVTDPKQLSRMIEDRARVLKQQMSEYLDQAKWVGQADAARIDLMVRAYGKDRVALEAFRQRCLDTHRAMTGPDLRLRDVQHEFREHFLSDVYQREVALRGNFAAASDVVRLQVEALEGGRYTDMDYLPALADTLGGVDIRGFNETARIGVLQVLLNHNDALMPGRDPQRYPDRTEKIPAEHKETLLAFARRKPGLKEIFVAPQDNVAAPDAIRLGTSSGTQTASEMNAHMLAHPGSGMTESIMQMIRINYDCLYEVERRLLAAGVSWGDEPRVNGVIQDVMRDALAQGRLTTSHQDRLVSLAQGIADYYRDGIRIGARGTIDLTGPGAADVGIQHYIEAHLLPDPGKTVRARLKLKEGYNVATEEEKISGWTVNGNPEEWLAKEQEKWTLGKLKSRYAGNLSELLKEQTLTFNKGWPVIEGKPVLLTSVLQDLLDDLGEPFRRAMNDRLSGDVTFHQRVSLSFEQRRQILAQSASDLPPSVGGETLGNLNEALTRIAAGKLPVDQLSPLHRVVLGGLFDAQTLDEQGFAQTWERTHALARDTEDRGLAARYEAIETLLRGGRDPRQLGGVRHTPADAAPGAHSARVLKAQAFADPLSVRQWREHIAHIETVAKEEYRASILQRGGPVQKQLFEAGATIAKQLPQDLLVRDAGTPGRRCYPLVLVMAAALEQGESGERALIGKLANASLSPRDIETRALLSTLEALRSIPMADLGVKHGQTNLGSVAQTLERKTTSTTLMLNTDNHSLLMAKVVRSGQSAYYFYDPNFGLYRFAALEALHQGVERFLATESIARIYGVKGGGEATFNLLELNGARIAEIELASQSNVGHLLRNEPIVGQRTGDVWQHHAALSVRSLSENARLGNGLALLDAQAWAHQIESATHRLQTQHQLSRDFVPMFESMKKGAGGQTEITLINARDPEQTRTVVAEDERLQKINAHLSEAYKALAVKAPRPEDPTHADAVHTLNAGFAIQALLFALKDRELADQDNGSTALTSAVRLHGYLAYAQLTHGVAVDVVQVVNLARHVFTDSLLVARTTEAVVFNALGHVANEVAGGVLQLAAVGFDIYLLAHAENDTQRAQFATQLAFDSASVLLGVGGLGATYLGAGTAAAFLGGASVILGGLAIGIGALVQGFSGILEQARQVGDYLNHLAKAYRTGGYSSVDDAFSANPYAVITLLDLNNRRIELASQEIYGAFTSALHPPHGNPDRSKALNIRQSLQYPAIRAITEATPFESVVLPCAPRCCLGFGYKALPFATTRHEHFETALKLEYNSDGIRQFWFSFYRFPTEYVLNELVSNYEPTTITVVLEDSNRFLHVPTLPREIHGYLSYDIQGVGGQCTVTLAEGVKVMTLSSRSGMPSMSWALSATWLNEVQVRVEGDRLQLGTTQVQVPDQTTVHLQLAQQSYQVDWGQGALLITEIEVDSGKQVAGALEVARDLARHHRLAGRYTRVHNVLVPYGDPLQPIYTTAHYDRIEDRLLYVHGLAPAFEASACLGAKVGQDAFYYVPDEVLIWRANAITGQVNRIYRLMDPVSGSRISTFQALGEGLIRIVQKVELRDGSHMKMTYLLGANELSLLAVTGKLTERQVSMLQRKHVVSLANFFWDYELMVRDQKLAPFDAVSVVDYQGNALTQINYFETDASVPSSLWLRRDDGLIVRPHLPADGEKSGSRNLVLLNTHEADGDTFLFYDQARRSLYRQRVNAQDEPAVNMLPEEVTEVFFQAPRHIALTQSGMLFQLDTHDDARLIGLNQDWLAQAEYTDDRGFQWWKWVLVVAREFAADGFEVYGLKNVPGNAHLSVWCLDGRLLIADTGTDHAVRLLTQTPDKTAAWLWDAVTGRVYRQPFMAIEDFPAAFANGRQLLRQDSVPAWREVAPSWSFTQVLQDDPGLRGLSRERVWVELRDDVPPRVVGVEGDYLHALGSSKEREEKLRALVASHEHRDVLSAGRIDDLFTWYDVRAARLLSSTVASQGRWPVYLGARDGETPLLHEPLNHQLFSNRNGVWWMPEHDVWGYAGTARREAQVLSLDSRDSIEDLQGLIPDGVTTLVLGYADRQMLFLVSLEAWLRLDCLIVDFLRLEPKKCQLLLPLETMDQWRIILAGGHVMLTDPNDGRSLILRNAQSASTLARQMLTLFIDVSGSVKIVTLERLMMGLTEGPSVELSAQLNMTSPA